MARTYRPRFDSQRDADDPYRRVACAAASTSMAIDRATLGGLVPGQRLVRSLTDEPIPDPRSPGLTVTQCVGASVRLRVPLVHRPDFGFGGLAADLVAGRGAIVAILYGSLPAEYRSDPDYEAGHMVYVNDRDTGTGWGWLDVADPLAAAWRRWPKSVLRRAMLDYDADGDYAVTRVTPALA